MVIGMQLVVTETICSTKIHNITHTYDSIKQEINNILNSFGEVKSSSRQISI